MISSEDINVEGIKNYLIQLKARRYTTGVFHITPPEWLFDLRRCIEIIEALINKLEQGK